MLDELTEEGEGLGESSCIHEFREFTESVEEEEPFPTGTEVWKELDEGRHNLNIPAQEDPVNNARGHRTVSSSNGPEEGVLELILLELSKSDLTTDPVNWKNM